MKKSTLKQTITAVLLFILLILAYILSEKYMADNMPRPRYDSYDQSNRLDKIRKGLER